MAPNGRKEKKKAKDTPKPPATKNDAKKQVVEKVVKQKTANKVVETNAEKKQKQNPQNDAEAPSTVTSSSSSSSSSAAPPSKSRGGKAAHATQKLDISSLHFRNKQKTLIFSTRGLTAQTRHLMQDLRVLLPHSVKDAKLDTKDRLHIVNEVCDMKNATNCIFFEARKHRDYFMWMTVSPLGPSVKFLIQNVHTMDELRLMGNCLKGSRPIVSFSSEFDSQPFLRLIKEMFSQIFPTPLRHPKSKPFFDHVFTFSYLDNHIWFRNYQVMWMDETTKATELVEIGPRFVLQPIRIFSGSMQGETIYHNSEYVSPNALRSLAKRQAAVSAMLRNEDRQSNYSHKLQPIAPRDEVNDILRP